MSLTLLEEDMLRIRQSLGGLLERSESERCLLCQSSGIVIAQEGRGEAEPLLISALGAGVFGASRELARLLGENEFSAIFHQGERRSIYIRAVTADAILVVVFSNTAKVGLVRFYAGPAAAELQAVLQDVARPDRAPWRPEQPLVLAEGAGDLFSAPAAQ